MSSIHYFQRYSQAENVATNNTLLLLSRLYQHSPIKAYGIHDRLIIDDEAWMRVVTCGLTLQENFQYNLYYDPRRVSPHNYIGIYKNKSVRGIGKVENIIMAEFIDDYLNIIDSTSEVTEVQMNNIKEAIASAESKHNWNIAKGYKFYCVDNFYETDFKKMTKYLLRGTRLFNLKKELQLEKLPSTEEIANRLKNIQWE